MIALGQACGYPLGQACGYLGGLAWALLTAHCFLRASFPPSLVGFRAALAGHYAAFDWGTAVALQGGRAARGPADRLMMVLTSSGQVDATLMNTHTSMNYTHTHAHIHACT